MCCHTLLVFLHSSLFLFVGRRYGGHLPERDLQGTCYQTRGLQSVGVCCCVAHCIARIDRISKEPYNPSNEPYTSSKETCMTPHMRPIRHQKSATAHQTGLMCHPTCAVCLAMRSVHHQKGHACTSYAPYLSSKYNCKAPHNKRVLLSMK